VDLKEAELSQKDRFRYIDFKEAYNYTNNTVLKYLYYFRNLTNLFDLEFF
jgi:hypothetical protein